jgi:glycosyltransferase involved in cell wall biosynthesis
LISVEGGEWRTIHNFVDTGYYKFHPTAPEDGATCVHKPSRVERSTAIKITRCTGSGIEYIGPVHNLQKNLLLGRTAAMIVPIEWNESFGIVFAEALACGTPTIFSACGAIPEIVRPEIEGFLLKSIEESCVVVASLPKIRISCRKRVGEYFSGPVVAAQYERLYDRIAARQ